jgi:hypothetical protein
MTAAKGNQYALRPGAAGRSTSRHVIPVTAEEHERHHALAEALSKKLAVLVRELLNERADQVLPPAAKPSPRRKARALR